MVNLTLEFQYSFPCNFQLVQRFEILWTGASQLDCQSHLINRPDKPLQFRFVERIA